MTGVRAQGLANESYQADRICTIRSADAHSLLSTSIISATAVQPAGWAYSAPMSLKQILCAILICFTSWTLAQNPEQGAAVRNFFTQHEGVHSSHTNNWAVLVCASRYWFNYRVCNGLFICRYILNGFRPCSIWRTRSACKSSKQRLDTGLT